MELWIERKPTNKSGAPASRGNRSTVCRIDGDKIDDGVDLELIASVIQQGLRPLYVVGVGEREFGYMSNQDQSILARAHARARELHEQNLQLMDQLHEKDLELERVLAIKEQALIPEEQAADKLKKLAPMLQIVAKRNGWEVPDEIWVGLEHL